MKKLNGGAVLRTVRFCAVITLTALVTCSAAISRAARIGAQASQAPKPAEAAVPKPNPDELEGWRQTIVHTKRPKKACYTAQYPATTWTEVPCGKPPKVKFLPAQTPQIVGGHGGADVSAQAPPPQLGLITAAEGSFDSVTVKTECDTGCPTGGCTTKKTCSSSDKQNDFSLQLNTNQAHSYACGASQKCRGWEQFIFSNRQCTSGLFGSQIGGSPACAFIEYWLYDYGPNCPAPWQQSGNDCTAWSQNSASVSSFYIADLGFMKLKGEAPGVAGLPGGDDEVIFTYADKVYSAPGDDLLPDVGQWWQYAEFNIFGDSSFEQAVFGPGTSLVVRTVVDSQTNYPPGCVLGGTTGESNNLILTQVQSRLTNAPIRLADIASTQSGNAFTGPYSGGPGPAVVFAESNAPDACPVVVGDSNAPPTCPAPANAYASCVGEVLVGGTQPIPPPGGRGTGGTATTGCGKGECCIVPGVRACQKCSSSSGQCP